MFRIGVLLCCTLVAEPALAAGRPNVLMILVDDLKPSFAAYGDDWVHSPNLDRLANRGLLFNAAYCNQAVCAPSRYNLLLGTRSTSLGLYGLATNFRTVAPQAVTLQQHFMQHGYHVAGAGKVFHVGHGNTDDSASWSEPFRSDKVVDYALRESTGGQLTREAAYFSNQQLERIADLPRGAAWERADVADEKYADGRIAAEGIRLLRARAAQEQPFLLMIGFVKPHLPFCAPEKYWRLYDDIDLPLATMRDYPAGAPPCAQKPPLGELNQYEPIPSVPPLAPGAERKLVQGYYAAMSFMDAQLGKVLDELDALGLADDTIVVLWGDHGFHLGDHGAWTKHTNYEQANRIPLIFAGPGVPRGTKTAALAETVDLYPTLAKLAGLPAPTGPQPIDGISLAEVLRNPQSTVHDYVYHAFPRPKNLIGRAIRTSRYRLVEWKEPTAAASTAQYELYDYEDDPQETRNLAADRPDVVASLKAILAEHAEAALPAVAPRMTTQRTAAPTASRGGRG